MSDQADRLVGRISPKAKKITAGVTMLLCVAAVFVLPFEFLRVGHRLTVLVGLFCYCAYTLHRRWWVPVLAFVVMMGVCVYTLGGDLFAYEMISERPLQPLPTLEVSVVPGGELFKWSALVEQRTSIELRRSWVTVCFYVPDDDLCAIAAHSCGLEAGDVLDLTEDSEALPAGPSPKVRVLADVQEGVAIKKVKCPEPDRKAIPLAGEEDIKVGEEAVIRTLSTGDIRVEVMGFTTLKDGHFLVLQLLDDDVEVGPGMSGSPVMQSGKIVAFFSGITPYVIGPDFLLARPAVEVYQALQEHLEQ